MGSVAFSADNRQIVSAARDKNVKLWNLTNCKLKTNHIGHTGYLNTVTMSPDGSLCASGGKDAWAMLIPLMPSPSAPTGTGCALPLAQPSRSGTLRARTWLRNSGLRCLEPRGLIHPSACLSPGAPMARLSLLDTVTTSSVSGRCLLLAPGRSFPATKKSPALPLLKKKHRRKLSWPCARSARCTVRSKLYVHIVLILCPNVHMQLCLNSVAAI